MATLSITNITDTSYNWRITGLDKVWNSLNYKSAGISFSSATNSIFPPSEIIATYYPPYTGSGYSVPELQNGFISNLSPGTTYTIYGWAQQAASPYTYWTAGQVTFTTKWEWWTPKTSGVGFNVAADEWLAFCNTINKIRVAKGLTEYSFTTSADYIAKDKPFYAYMFLQAANAINEINGQVSTECLNVVSGNDIYAWYFENLKTALNNAIV